MPTPDVFDAADHAAIEEVRKHQGDAAASEFSSKLYLVRRTPRTNYLAGFPKWGVILFAVWVVAIETADKLPQIMLSYPRYEAALAETQAKLLQPELVRAQLATAVNEAKASDLKPAMTQAQLDRAVSDAVTAKFTAEAAPTQLAMAVVNLGKTTSEATTAKFAAEAAP